MIRTIQFYLDSSTGRFYQKDSTHAILYQRGISIKSREQIRLVCQFCQGSPKFNETGNLLNPDQAFDQTDISAEVAVDCRIASPRNFYLAQEIQAGTSIAKLKLAGNCRPRPLGVIKLDSKNQFFYHSVERQNGWYEFSLASNSFEPREFNLNTTFPANHPVSIQEMPLILSVKNDFSLANQGLFSAILDAGNPVYLDLLPRRKTVQNASLELTVRNHSLQPVYRATCQVTCTGETTLEPPATWVRPSPENYLGDIWTALANKANRKEIFSGKYSDLIDPPELFTPAKDGNGNSFLANDGQYHQVFLNMNELAGSGLTINNSSQLEIKVGNGLMTNCNNEIAINLDTLTGGEWSPSNNVSHTELGVMYNNSNKLAIPVFEAASKLTGGIGIEYYDSNFLPAVVYGLNDCNTLGLDKSVLLNSIVGNGLFVDSCNSNTIAINYAPIVGSGLMVDCNNCLAADLPSLSSNLAGSGLFFTSDNRLEVDISNLSSNLAGCGLMIDCNNHLNIDTVGLASSLAGCGLIEDCYGKLNFDSSGLVDILGGVLAGRGLCTDSEDSNRLAIDYNAIAYSLAGSGLCVGCNGDHGLLELDISNLASNLTGSGLIIDSNNQLAVNALELHNSMAYSLVGSGLTIYHTNQSDPAKIMLDAGYGLTYIPSNSQICVDLTNYQSLTGELQLSNTDGTLLISSSFIKLSYGSNSLEVNHEGVFANGKKVLTEA